MGSFLVFMCGKCEAHTRCRETEAATSYQPVSTQILCGWKHESGQRNALARVLLVLLVAKRLNACKYLALALPLSRREYHSAFREREKNNKKKQKTKIQWRNEKPVQSEGFWCWQFSGMEHEYLVGSPAFSNPSSWVLIHAVDPYECLFNTRKIHLPS